MKKIIAILALVASGVVFSATSAEWGEKEWATYCNAMWDTELSTQEEINEINANMMWADNVEFQAVNSQRWTN